jgi:carbohydrate kinase (thermoresistant glucokinase family)
MFGSGLRYGRGVRIVVMGPSGAGKSAVGGALADRLGVSFVDADELHPPANVAKMTAGTALTDADRMPWLDLVGAALASQEHVVVACSALRRAYRARILMSAPDAVFVELRTERSELERRMSQREHFMPPSLLDSQLEALEPLAEDEPGFAVANVDGIVAVADRIAHVVRDQSPR